MIESTLNTSIKLSLGAFRSSLIESMRNLTTDDPPELSCMLERDDIVYMEKPVFRINS